MKVIGLYGQRAAHKGQLVDKYKQDNLPAVTFAGTFSYRSNDKLIDASGFAALDVEYLIVAGGGAGGGGIGGGGGAGELITGTEAGLAAGSTNAVVVGNGGTPASGTGGDGSTSSAFSVPMLSLNLLL